MMKLLGIILLAMIMILSACTAPPEDVPQATVQADVVDEGDVEETNDVAQVANEAQEEPFEPVVVQGLDNIDVRAIDQEASSFEFEGYAVGKSHTGTFTQWDGSMIFDNGELRAAQGTIQTASVRTGIGGLDNHLKADDFFDVEQYPEITIESTTVRSDSVTADLTFRGVTKSITFPATVTENSISADFVLDTTDFAMTNTGVNSDVRLMFTMVSS